jgi:hypothetical protein
LLCYPLVKTVLLLELIYSSGRINQSGFVARIERMTLGANLNLYVFPGGPYLKLVAASASGHGPGVLGMNFLFHFFLTSLQSRIINLVYMQFTIKRTANKIISVLQVKNKKYTF